MVCRVLLALSLLVAGCSAAVAPPVAPVSQAPAAMAGPRYDAAYLPAPGTVLREDDPFWKLIVPIYQAGMAWNYRFTPIHRGEGPAHTSNRYLEIEGVEGAGLRVRTGYGPGEPKRVYDASRPFLLASRLAEYTALGLEEVVVPTGTFKGALKFAYRELGWDQPPERATLQGDGVITSEQFVWIAPGIGMVKQATVYTGPDGSEAAVQELTSFVDGKGFAMPPLPPAPSAPPEATPILLGDGAALPALSCEGDTVSTAPVVETLAGNGTQGAVDGPGAEARFMVPRAIAVDGRTGVVYVTDPPKARVRAILPDGAVRTVAGSGVHGHADGQGLAAQFKGLGGLAVDDRGNVFVGDPLGHRIRKIDPQGNVSTIAGDGTPGTEDGVGIAARFNLPNGLALDAQGNLYVADTGSSRIRMVRPDGTVSTLAVGEPSQGLESFTQPWHIAVDRDGTAYFSGGSNVVHRLTPDGRVVRYVGTGHLNFRDGHKDEAQFSTVAGLALDGRGHLYVVDLAGHRIRRVDLESGDVTTVAGDGNKGLQDGPAHSAQFAHPTDVAVGPCGTVYVADQANYAIRRIR